MQRENTKEPICFQSNLTREEWDAMTDEERWAVAKELASRLAESVEELARVTAPKKVSPFRYYRR